MNNQDIKIIVYSSKTDDHFEKILNTVPDFFPKNQIFSYSHPDDFSIGVRDLLFGFGIVLILVRDGNELTDILKMSKKLKDHSVILILDNSIEDLTHQYLKLYPRYTSYIKDDYTDVFLVLEKMITKIQNLFKGGANGRGCQ